MSEPGTKRKTPNFVQTDGFFYKREKMKKLFVTTIFFTLIIFSVSAQNRAPGNIVGIWLSEDKNVEVEIYKHGPQYFGKQVWSQFLYEADGTTSEKEENNSNAELSRRDLKNLIILTNFDYDGGVYDGGTFFDYKSGKKYKSIIKIKGSDVLKVRNYTFVSLFGKTTTWTRVSNELHPR
jgi:uncharacterized protein (DUF2147 family)